MIVVTGTRRPPKVNAVRHVFESVAEALGHGQQPVRVVALEVDSGIGAMPMSLRALMQGAQNRAARAWQQAVAQGLQPDFSVGMEGGCFSEDPGDGQPRYFLQSWVYVQGRRSGYFGCSAAVPVPNRIVRELVVEGRELGDIIDRYGKERRIRDKGGAFEVFTQGRLIRQKSYEMALICALAPFYNPELYER